MKKYVTYDKANNILFAYYTNLTLTPQLFDQVITETSQWAAKLPKKVFFLACLQNTKVNAELQQVWGSYTLQLLEYVKGVVRYDANYMMTNVTIRINTVRYHTQGINSHIYPSSEVALEAIWKLEKA